MTYTLIYHGPQNQRFPTSMSWPNLGLPTTSNFKTATTAHSAMTFSQIRGVSPLALVLVRIGSAFQSSIFQWMATKIFFSGILNVLFLKAISRPASSSHFTRDSLRLTSLTHDPHTESLVVKNGCQHKLPSFTSLSATWQQMC